MFKLRKNSTATPRVAAPLTGLFSSEEIAKIDRIGTSTTLAAGTKFLTEGVTGHQVVVILKGTATVEQDGELVATVGPGDFVGEISVIKGTPRNASLVAATALSVVVFTTQEFDRLLVECPRVESVLTELASSRQEVAV